MNLSIAHLTRSFGVMALDSNDDLFFSQMFGEKEKEDGVEQDSAEWHVWRSKGLGSSDAAVLMYTSPWRELQDVWNEKTGTVKPKNFNNWAIQRGKDLEPVARDIYNFQHKIEMRPTTFVHSRFKFMRASLDGFSRSHNYGIEIKVPGKKDLDLAKAGIVPDKYFAQIQWQMLCAGCNRIDYCVLDPDSSDLHIVKVMNDDEYQRRLVLMARWFWFMVRNKHELPMRRSKIYDPSVPELRGEKSKRKRGTAL